MTAPRGDWEIELWAAVAIALIVGAFAALLVYLSCGCPR
jgi:hypothetical protein